MNKTACWLHIRGNSGSVTDAQHVSHKPRWPIRINFLVLEMLSFSSQYWKTRCVTGNRSHSRSRAPGLKKWITKYRKWSPTVNDPQTANDHQNGPPQMILEPNDQRKIGMAWTQVTCFEAIKFNQKGIKLNKFCLSNKCIKGVSWGKKTLKAIWCLA